MEPTTWIIADSHKFEQNFSFFSNFRYLSYVCPRSGKIPICFSALNSRVIDTSCGARRFPELAEGGGHQSAAAETQTGETQYRTLLVIAQTLLSFTLLRLAKLPSGCSFLIPGFPLLTISGRTESYSFPENGQT